ncbi:MAG: SGNH/GDSL hydrolase family protein [Mobilicoccus sp.]|nr:SGNH/GDSL hydrolase family protein [Mobilicoccus sp.]
MRSFDHAPRLLAFALGPVLLPQGRRTLARVPRLDEAGGTATATVGDAHAPNTLSLLVAGESTAVGVGVDTHHDGIAPVIAAGLHEATDRTVTWHVNGRNGGRLRTTGARQLPPLTGEHDVIVLMLGVNDTLGLTSATRWRREIETLLTQARARLRPRGVIVLAGVPQLGTFTALPQPLRAVMGWHGAALDGVLSRVARLHADVVHVPTPAISDPEDLATDGFHPSATGYRRWGERLAEAVMPIA